MFERWVTLTRNKLVLRNTNCCKKSFLRVLLLCYWRNKYLAFYVNPYSRPFLRGAWVVHNAITNVGPIFFWKIPLLPMVFLWPPQTNMQSSQLSLRRKETQTFFIRLVQFMEKLCQMQSIDEYFRFRSTYYTYKVYTLFQNGFTCLV